MITGLLVLLLATSAYFIVENAREDVQAEVKSTANLALHLLDTEIAHYTSDFGWLNRGAEGNETIFRLNSLGNIRHLTIDFFDVNGKLRETNRHTQSRPQVAMPPAWFVRAMGLSEMGIEPHRRNIVLNGRYIGDLLVTPDPSYEIAEVWGDTIGLLALVMAFFVLMNLYVIWAVRYTFKPVGRIIAALTDMEKGNFSSRLPQFKQVELSEIGNKFNAMADTLQRSIENNHLLTQQIIRLQEDERKSLARDIHDEIGQYLTAIHVDASAILSAKRMATVKESARAISNVASQMMHMVHEMLQRLRPRVLDDLGISLALADLIHHWRQHNRGVTILHNISTDIPQLDDAVAVTIYRVVQECLTNIAKHAKAKRVGIVVKHDGGSIFLTVEDDGIGFDPNKMTSGHGLAGMRERVHGLCGEMHIQASGSGTKINMRIPKNYVTQQKDATHASSTH